MTDAQAAALYAFLNSARAPGVLRGMFFCRDLSAFNPMGEPPMTAGKIRSIAACRSPLEAAIIDLFDDKEPPFDRELFVIEWVKRALVDQGWKLDHVALQKVAAIVQAKPISAQRLHGRIRIKVNRPSLLPLDGQYRVWCIRNPRVWDAMQSADISRHLETGAMPLESVPAPVAANDDGTGQDIPESGSSRSDDAKPTEGGNST